MARKAAIKEKIYDKAVECFSALIDMEPAEASHYYHLALAQRFLGNNEDALTTYEAGIAQSQSNSTLLYYYGTLLDEVGKREKAVEVLSKSIKSDEPFEDAFQLSRSSAWADETIQGNRYRYLRKGYMFLINHISFILILELF